MNLYKGLIILLFFICPTMSHAQIFSVGTVDCAGESPGDAIACAIQANYQYWTTVSANPANYLREGRFVIQDIRKNVTYDVRGIPIQHDPPWADGDWNIWASPLSGYEDLLYNSRQVRNNNGLIEFEIHSAFPLKQYFNKGDVVHAFGWHVEDWGHSAPDIDKTATEETGGKTELHPLVYIQKGELFFQSFSLFAAQDTSFRFYPARWNSESYFDGWLIPLGLPRTIDLFNTAFSNSNSNFYLLEESATVDNGIASMSGSHQFYWDENHSIISADHSPGIIRIIPRFQPVGRYIQPLYFGEFRRDVEPLIQQTFSTDLKTIGATREQFIVAKISASMSDSTNYPPFVHSKWVYDQTHALGNVSTEVENPTGNSISYEVRYSPALGLNQHSWSLSVMAGTKPRNWSPGSARTNHGIRPAEKRLFGQALIHYEIHPSQVELEVSKIKKWFRMYRGAAAPAARPQRIECITGYQLKAKITKAHPRVSITRPLKWEAILTRTASGQIIANPIPAPVPGNGIPLDFGFVKVAVNPTRPDMLSVNFENTSAGLSPSTLVRPYMQNQARVKVAVRCSTGLGENPESITDELFVPVCLGNSRTLAESFSNFEKLIIAIIQLERMGISTSGGLPSSWPGAFLSQWSQNKLPLGPGYRWAKKLSPTGKRYADAYFELLSGESIASNRLKNLLSAMKKASTLPDLIRQIPPPAIKPANVILKSRGHIKPPKNPAIGMALPPSQIQPSTSHVLSLEIEKNNALSRESIQGLVEWARAIVRAGGIKVSVKYIASSGVPQKVVATRAKRVKQILLNEGVDSRRLALSYATGGAILKTDRIEITLR